MRLKINGEVVVEGTAVTVLDTTDLIKVNEIYRCIGGLLDKYDDITLIEVERM